MTGQIGGSRFARPLLLLLVLGNLGYAQEPAPSWPRPPGQVQAQLGIPEALRDVGIEQRLNEQVPADLVFRDETGKSVRLGDYFGSKPAILVLAYYRCPMLCTQVLNGLADRLRALRFDVGNEFQIITVSFDARETPEMAAAKKASYLETYGRPGAETGWHFLTGEQASIDRLTKTVGYHYQYNSTKDEFAHASGIMLLTPEGKLSRYFMGLTYSPRDLQLSLIEAAQNKIGSPVDQLMLYCFRFDGASGRYTLAVLNLVRAGGVLTVVLLLSFIVLARRRELRTTRREISTAG